MFWKGKKYFSWQLLFCTIDLLCCKYLQYLMRLLTYIGPTGCNTFIYLIFFFWKKPCPVDKPYPPVPMMLCGGCSVLVVLFIMVVIVGMIALVIHIMIGVSILDWYDLFCLNKGNVFIFQVIFFFFWSDLNKLINPYTWLQLESDITRLWKAF